MSRGHAFRTGRRSLGSLVITMTVLGLLAGGCPEESPRVRRVGILSGSDALLEIADAFRAGMTELGYVEGHQIRYDLQRFNAEPAMEEQGAQKFVADPVDLIVAFPTETALIAKKMTRGTNIPVVFVYAGLEGSGLVESVRTPGDNITGVRFPGPEQISRRLELLLELAPWVKLVWVGYLKSYPNTAPALVTLRSLAASRQVTLVEVPADSLSDLESDLAERSRGDALGLDSMLLMPDILNHSPAGWRLISRFAAEHNIPIAGSFSYTVEQGAVFGNANDLYDVGKHAASLSNRILKGIPAGTIPVVTPEQDLWINYKRARELGLTVPQGMLKMARRVIH
jgi:putative tryptophan/tyrosine transport system substrate-binding protein